MGKNKNLRAGDTGQLPKPPCRILVVEDESFARRVNVETLQAAGYEVESAEDGAVAWDTLQNNIFDLMVTDNNMPKMTGLELLKNLQDAGMVLPVIMATGILPRDTLFQNTQLQIEAILLKPYSPDELLAKVTNVLLANAEDPGRAALPSKPREPLPPAELRLSDFKF